MAAGGYKEFVAGETLDQDEINDFLMQGMLVFAGTAARGSAIGTAVEGQFSFLKDSDTVEFYDGSAWVELSAGAEAPFTVSYLAIAGGGGGGKYLAGGGGAGGYLESNFVLSSGTYSLKVGAGGAGGATNDGSNGVSSIFNSGTAVGGGGGGGANRSGLAGASSGGAGVNVGTTSSNSRFQGNDGGNGGNSTGGGGGGRGAVGAGGATNISTGNGGDGLASTITGSSVTRAGGGGGGGSPATSGGSGGGGDGGSDPGDANTGGGGGGSNTTGTNGGAGGSGVVIFSLPTSAQVTFSGGVTQTSSVVGGNTVYTVTAAGPTDTFTIG